MSKRPCHGSESCAELHLITANAMRTALLTYARFVETGAWVKTGFLN